MSNLTEKLKQSESGIVLYSLTPPAQNISSEKLSDLNRRRTGRISTIEVDGLSIYDVQEEKERNREKRTYQYKPALDPIKYGESLNNHSDLPQIIYLASGKYREEELNSIFLNNPDKIFILVGSPSKNTAAQTSLNRALEISNVHDNPVGAVFMGERHKNGKSEVERMLSKIDRGVDFFISQCIYNGSLYEKLLTDYKEESKLLDYPLKPLILTFSPIGNRNSLEFLKWLGIEIPRDFILNLPKSDDFLDYSVQYLEETGKRLIDYAMSKNIPIGINFESVIGRRAEVLASLKLAENLIDYFFNNSTRYLKSGVSALSRR